MRKVHGASKSKTGLAYWHETRRQTRFENIGMNSPDQKA
jgi:hypothetical protein